MIKTKRVTVIITLLMGVILLAFISFPTGINKASPVNVANKPKIILDAGHEGLVNTIKWI